MTSPPTLPTLNDADSDNKPKSQLDALVDKFAPVLQHVTVHRFLWGFTLLCALIAWNRGLMLLYVLVAFLLAVLLVSYLYRYLNLKNITISRDLPSLVAANQIFEMSYDITTRGHKHFLAISENYTRQNDAISLFDNQPTQSKTLTETLEPSSVALFFTHIFKQHTLSFEKSLPLRGVYLSNQAQLSSAYPLGLIEHTDTLNLPAKKIYVLPEAFDISHLDTSISNTVNNGGVRSSQHGGGDDLSGLRQYRRGDPMKQVHWGASAKQMSRQQPWLSKEFNSVSQPSMLIIINQFQHRGMAFERMLNIVISYAHYASRANLDCIIVGLEAINANKETKNKTTNNTKKVNRLWQIAVPKQAKHLQHNFQMLAKLRWITQHSSVQHSANIHSVDNHINSYSELVAQSMSAHASANTVITFNPFESPTLAEVTNIHIKIAQHCANSCQQSAHQFLYQVSDTASLAELTDLFNANSKKNNTTLAEVSA